MFFQKMLSYGLLGALLLSGDLKAASFSESQTETAFDKKVGDAILRAEREVQIQQANATTRVNAPTWNTKLELENAILQLEVKKTLVNNFKQTESLKSALVREKLLLILNKDVITTADLADLQSLVIQEKAKMKGANPPSTSPASPTPASSASRTNPTL